MTAKKRLPDFATDEAARDFVDTTNLADYDLSGGRLVQLKLAPKSLRIST